MKVARNKITMKPVTWFGPPTEAIRVDEYQYRRGAWYWKEK